VAIRAYDPCLSCATHALGRMPLDLELCAADGTILDRLCRHPDGSVARPSPSTANH
jgi:NAD-reducing hydrogenase large subunit